jgi:hypothetical protein
VRQSLQIGSFAAGFQEKGFLGSPTQDKVYLGCRVPPQALEQAQRVNRAARAAYTHYYLQKVSLIRLTTRSE